MDFASKIILFVAVPYFTKEPNESMQLKMKLLNLVVRLEVFQSQKLNGFITVNLYQRLHIIQDVKYIKIKL
ncbi:hypothetical protein NQ314_012340 [Rhamnusium bicolor]|uniref:Uncharacterized protein n=1 Tax=Rhamnusium bicolor TaxID=1586634 RepID=A0AAV8XCZ5_9CUCU|nr:hypothetical protein NQ314_012340 [Rhamnusium bicolor]